MAFRFRLEKVLSVRAIEEESARQIHAEAVRSLDVARVHRTDLEHRLARAERDLDERKRGDALDGEHLRLHGLHRTGLSRALIEARVSEEEARTVLEKAAAALLAAHQAREALVRLREREEAAWKLREARKETRMIDEMAVSRHRAPEEGRHGP